MDIKIYAPENWKDYELLDTGEGEKLERFGKYTFIRPYEDAGWAKTLGKEWENADGKFWSTATGAKAGWKIKKGLDERWPMAYRGVKFLAAPTPFRHLGFFPEQAVHWDFIERTIRNAKRPIKFLNLFGYTGVASLFALRSGAEVTHVDASNQTLDWAKENQKFSGMQDLPMRVIEDDVIKFLEREAKRGNKYDAVIMDPPKFGRGPKGETWKIEKDLPRLLSAVKNVLSEKPLFIILTSYATDASSLPIRYALEETMSDFKGKVEGGEMCLEEKSHGRLVSLSNTAIWTAK